MSTTEPEAGRTIDGGQGTSRPVHDMWRRPPRSLSWTVSVFLCAAWVLVRLVLFRDLIFPLTYALPLLVCVWTRDKAALWVMAVFFAASHTVKQFWLLPVQALPEYADWMTWIATELNVVVGAVIVHAIIVLRDRLEASFEQIEQQAEELARQNEELAQQAEELSVQSEEMSQQLEELSQQSEEFARQNEELQAQSGEIQSLNSDLAHRERLLRGLLDAARLSYAETGAMQAVCATAVDMLAGIAALVVVYEKHGGQLVMRAAAGAEGEQANVSALPGAAHAFADLVVQQNRTAALNDTSLRPDLEILTVPGRPRFEAVLGAPMREGETAFGAVMVYSRQRQEWTEQQFHLVEWLALQCAQILHLLRLQHDLRRQAALIDLSPDGIIVRLMDGTITTWSRGAEALYGWSKAEALTTTTHALLKTRFPQPLGEINRQLEQTGHWAGELVHATKDGRQVVVESRWLLFRDAERDVVELLESNVDITERKRTEDALREADRHKSEFLATLSHELRNPLAPIRYALELLPADSGKDQGQPRRVIERQMNHLVRLVDDLLDVTRIASNKVRLRKERADLCAIVQQAVEAAVPDIEQARHSLTLALPREPLWLHADPDRLAQVLTNLLTNAARYTPPGGRIHLAAAAVHGEVVVSVSDTGIGLSKADLTRVFEMFAQVGEPGHGGLGIGLALVKGLVELHGGSVEAHSDGPGKGSEFRFRLPLTTESAGPPVAGERGVAAIRPRRILVVDDNADAADMMKTFLELQGHQVEVAYDGQTALATAVGFSPEIGLFDIGLPNMSGYELARRMREQSHHRPLFLIAVTGWGQEEDRVRARDHGFDAHLTKPADPDQVQRLITRASAVLDRSGIAG